jgi:hypothetical protein
MTVKQKFAVLMIGSIVAGWITYYILYCLP